MLGQREGWRQERQDMTKRDHVRLFAPCYRETSVTEIFDSRPDRRLWADMLTSVHDIGYMT